MKKYEVEIQGKTPLIWNVMKKELEDERGLLKKDEMKEWEDNPKNWQRKAELDTNDAVIVPDRWIKHSLIEACKKTRLVPHFATTKKATYTDYVTSFFIENGHPLCKKSELLPFGSYVGAQGKNSSTKVWRIRPYVKEWGAKFLFIDPSGRMKKDELKTLLEFAGMFIGVGDNRINNYGRFNVQNVKEVS